MPHAEFDVFLSYNRADQAEVLKLAAQLKERGLNPWLDVWNLVAGEPWLPAVENALANSQACAVLVGPAGLGGVHQHEMWTAIEHSLSAQDGHVPYRVIPTLLPHSTRGDRATLPRFLSRHTWIEFAQSLDEPGTIDKLVKAIRGEAPGATAAKTLGQCPYRGLAHFEIADAPLFFGREALTDWLLSRLRGTATTEGPTRFLAIVGASGSGKSSLARAGLLAKLKQGELAGSDRWPIVVCRPENRPLESLAAALANADGVQLGTGLKSELIAQLEASLLKSPDGLHKVALAALPSDDPNCRLVVFVDQFEELFTLNPLDSSDFAVAETLRPPGLPKKSSPGHPGAQRPSHAAGSAASDTSASDSLLSADRVAYVQNLLHAATIAGGRTIVVLTMRADFYGKCATLPELATAVSQHQELVGPMSRDELRRAIETPAQLSGSDIEPGLVDQLVREVAAQPGALPLLQYALAELWQKSRDLGQSQMTSAAYRELGGWEGALSRRADAVLNGFKGTPRETLCRQLFLRLVQPGEGTEDTKRLVRWQEMRRGSSQEAAELEATLRELVDSRLLTASGENLKADSTVEVIHEALIRGWAALRKWLDADRAGLRTHRQLTDAANEWAKSHADANRRDSSLLYTGTRLAVARELAKRGDVAFNDIEGQFLAASSQAMRSRKRRSLLTWAGTATAALLLAVVGTLVALNNQNEARAREMVESLKNAKESQVPQIVAALEGYRRWADEPLRQLFAGAAADSSAKLHAALALAPVGGTVGAGVIPHLRERLLTATPAQFPLVRDALGQHDSEHRQQFEDLWKTAQDAATPIARRFQAACALATYAPEDARWPDVAPTVAQQLVGLPSAELVAWREALRPARKQLQQPLAGIFAASAKETQARQLAAETLADFAADNGALLAQAMLEADPKTFEPLLAAVRQAPAAAIARFQQELDEKLEPEWNDAPLDPTWQPIDAVSSTAIRTADGLVDDRYALCLSLPVAELAALSEALRPTGYRPTSIVTWPRGDDVLAAVVWTRDGRDWNLAGPIDAQAAVEFDQAQRRTGLRPKLVDSVPPTGRQVCVLWGPAASTLPDPATGGGENGRLEPAAAPSSLPMTWAVKFFRYEPGENAQPPADWAAAVAGEPFLEREYPQLNFNVPADQAKGFQYMLIAARGTIVLERGEYLLWLVADDGARIYLNDKLMLDRWTENDRQPAVATISVAAGRHDLRVEHYQLDGALVLGVRLGHPQVQLASDAAEPAVEGVSAAPLFESSPTSGVDPAVVITDLRKLLNAGFRPFTVNSALPQPDQATRVDVACRRPAVPEEARDSLARRQSHAGVALARLGQVGVLWPRLAFTPDPRLRTELIHDLGDYRADLEALLDRLGSEQEVSTRRALLLALGQFPADQLPADRRGALIEKLLVDYENEPDAGLHGAIEWLLRKWGQHASLKQATEKLAQASQATQASPASRAASAPGFVPKPAPASPPAQNKRWYITSQLQTFVILPAGEFQMGSPASEPQRDADETPHRRQIERPFAIAATEVTRAQYLAFVKATGARDPANQYVKTLDSPQTGMEWFEAARYCNWLSEQEGIDPAQWCFEPNEQKQYGPGMKTRQGFLDLAGYRLPTEAEWEYACRAGAATSRHYGNSEARLQEFAWYLANSSDRSWPVGEKKPNDAGLFDMLGNALEWCHDAAYGYPASQGAVSTLTEISANMDASLSRVLRGGSFSSQSANVRSGYRNLNRPGNHGTTVGFRPARTYR